MWAVDPAIGIQLPVLRSLHDASTRGRRARANSATDQPANSRDNKPLGTNYDREAVSLRDAL